MQKSQSFIKKYKAISLFLSNFLRTLNGTIPYNTGVLKMKYRDFVLYEVLGMIAGVVLLSVP